MNLFVFIDFMCASVISPLLFCSFGILYWHINILLFIAWEDMWVGNTAFLTKKFVFL